MDPLLPCGYRPFTANCSATDLDTGDVIHLTADVREELEAFYAELPEEPTGEEAYKAAFASAHDRPDLPGWMHEAPQEADAVESGLGIRLLRLPEHDSRESYFDMLAFIETVAHPRLVERSRPPFGVVVPSVASRTLLADYPAERERWFAFRAARMRQRVLAWLADEGIEPVGATG